MIDQPNDNGNSGWAVAWRLPERLLLGEAALTFAGDSVASDSGTSWLSDMLAYAGFLGVNAKHLVIGGGAVGRYAIVGAVRNSDTPGESGTGIMGVAGYVVNDRTMGDAWAHYSEVQHEAGANWSAGHEFSIKNKGANLTDTPYHDAGGAFGAWLAAFGNPVYGGEAANPSNTAVAIVNNGQTWNKGIVVKADALTGCDGVTGTATVLEVAKGHRIEQKTPADTGGGYIHFDVASGSGRLGLKFSDNAVCIVGANGYPVFTAYHDNGAVNSVVYRDAVSGQAPRMLAYGSDADIDLSLEPKGNGRVKFGARVAHADAAITGYVEIKDAGGTVRKLAVIS